MAKMFQVRYTVGDKTVAHEHYTDKGAKTDAKALSKAIGNAMIGEIDVDDDGVQHLVRMWEFTGGESSKPIKKDGEVPSEVEVLKTADETKTTESNVEKKPKGPRLTIEERIAAKKAEYEAGLASIAAGTYIIKTPGKAASGEPKKPKVVVDKTSKIMESLGCSQKAAQILSKLATTVTSRRAKVAAMIIDHEGAIPASEIETALRNDPKEEEEVTLKKVISAVTFVDYLLSKHEQPWRITIKNKGDGEGEGEGEGGGQIYFNFVPVRIEYQGEAAE
jgi:hypothetical protein